MQNPPREVIVAFILFIIFWVLVVVSIFVLSQRWERARLFRERMLGQWRPALVITIVYFVSVFFSGRGFNPYGLAIFCQALIGLTLARGIPNFEPLPVSQSILRGERVGRSLVLFLLFALLAAILATVVGTIGLGIAQSIFHETNLTDEAMKSFSVGKFQAFFLFLSGAGIAEETTYRLVLLSLLWALTRRRGLAIFVSALLFGAYHLTPLDGMYLTFLKFPVSQFLASTLIGIVWGYIFVKRGYETSVFAHTLSDWLPMLLFM
jgi:membrane protease YdiL (CAAX protease family)